MPYIRLRSINPGTPKASGGQSDFGHAWIEISPIPGYPDAGLESYGFYPEFMNPETPGNMETTDAQDFLGEGTSTAWFHITDAQAARVREFTRVVDESTGYWLLPFGTNLGLAPVNNCATYAAQAMRAAGISTGLPFLSVFPWWAPGLYSDPSRGTWEAEGWVWGLDPEVQTLFDSALRFVFVRDPLVLDLDGDGLELTAATGQVLFDHNADGIRTGTGWVASDDGLLVLDRNGNGTIDSGRELFGVETVKSNGQFAREGFDALRDLDANGDGVFNASDAAFAQVRVWRDLDPVEVDLAGLTARLAWAQAGASCAGGRHLRCH